jgi:hypothetical protein
MIYLLAVFKKQRVTIKNGLTSIYPSLLSLLREAALSLTVGLKLSSSLLIWLRISLFGWLSLLPKLLLSKFFSSSR